MDARVGVDNSHPKYYPLSCMRNSVLEWQFQHRALGEAHSPLFVRSVSPSQKTPEPRCSGVFSRIYPVLLTIKTNKYIYKVFGCQDLDTLH